MSSKESDNSENNKNKPNSSAAASSGGSSVSSKPSGSLPYEAHQYVGPYRLEKTLGKGQTGKAKKLICLVFILKRIRLCFNAI